MNPELQQIISDLERRIEYRQRQAAEATERGSYLDAGGFRCICTGLREAIAIVKEHGDVAINKPLASNRKKE